MSDRLLSDEEIENTVSEFYSEMKGHRKFLKEIAKAQDLKTSQWWVEKIEDMVLFCDNAGCDHSNCQKWKSLKKEAGL